MKHFYFYRLFFIFVLSCLSISAAADEGVLEGIGLDLLSPVTTPALTPLLIGSGATVFFYGTRFFIEDPLQTSWATRKPLGTTSQFGDQMGELIPNALYAAGMAIDGWGWDNPVAKRRAILMLKASIYSGVVVDGLKYVFREPRPNGSPDMAAFPSGNATSAFTFAAVVGAEHEWYWGVPAYALATFAAAARINDNMHRLHDVVGGATLGMSYGLGTYYRMHENDDPKKVSMTAYQVIPTDRLDGAVFTVLHEF